MAPPVIVVGNKSDLVEERKVTQEEGQELANSCNSSYMETSAKDNHNIQEVSHCNVVAKMWKKISDMHAVTSEPTKIVGHSQLAFTNDETRWLSSC